LSSCHSPAGVQLYTCARGSAGCAQQRAPAPGKAVPGAQQRREPRSATSSTRTHAPWCPLRSAARLGAPGSGPSPAAATERTPASALCARVVARPMQQHQRTAAGWTLLRARCTPVPTSLRAHTASTHIGATHTHLCCTRAGRRARRPHPPKTA
jgi:hypothetical protein